MEREFRMSETFRLRPSSRSLIFALCCTALLTVSTALFAADFTRTPVPSYAKTSVATTARAALFDSNNLQRAAKLAARELRRSPRDLDAWFLLQETGWVLEDQPTEIRAALSLCKLAPSDDPRVSVAALRLASFGQNSEFFRQQRASIESLAAGQSICAAAATAALYQASLDGLNNTDVRKLAQASGWLTRWKIVRTGSAAAKFVPEQFEFVDARIQLPDYLPRAASYVAETTFNTPAAGEYVVSGNVAATKLLIDNHPVNFGPLDLAAGSHNVRITFRAAESSPRIRIAAARSGELRWTGLNLSPREALYLQAEVALEAGRSAEATGLIRKSELASTAIGDKLIVQSEQAIVPPAEFESFASHPSCGNLQAELSSPEHNVHLEENLRSCAPDSLAYAHWLATTNRHVDAIHELSQLLHEWPLDRDAHRMLIAELQRVGNSAAADRAAADFLAVAPNAHNFRRMAETANSAIDAAGTPFYEAYRRAAPAALPAFETSLSPEVILLQDKVAITRLDGSISLYMHRVVELMTSEGAHGFQPLAIPDGGQLLSARVVSADATQTSGFPPTLKPGDEVEEEYVVNYTGDGGMIAHPEAFQYVFNDFDSPLLNARFVVLSPSKESPGYVIASGKVPASRMEYFDDLAAQIWEQDKPVNAGASDPAIVRVVENENGWSIPPSVERRRNLETIHPGPRNREV